MKEKLLALLVLKFKGVDKAILEKIAEKKAEGLTEESQLQNIADGVEFGDILKSEADRRATLATQTAIDKYEKQHGLKDGKPVQQDPPKTDPPKTDPPNGDDVPAWAKTMLESQANQITELKNLVSGVVTGQKISQKKADAKKLWDVNEVKLPEKWFETRLNYDSETSIEDQIKTLEEEYIEIQQGVVNESVASGTMIPQTFKTDDLKVEEMTKIMNGDDKAQDETGVVKIDV